jgi:hypothetical protein
VFAIQALDLIFLYLRNNREMRTSKMCLLFYLFFKKKYLVAGISFYFTSDSGAAFDFLITTFEMICQLKERLNLKIVLHTFFFSNRNIQVCQKKTCP